MTDDILATVVAALNAAKGEWREIAEHTGVPYDTITKIAQGKTKNPRIQSLTPLLRFFEARRVAAIAPVVPVVVHEAPLL